MSKTLSMVMGASFLVLAGCGTKGGNLGPVTPVTQDAASSAAEAGLAEYRYALSAQILDAATGQAIQNFTVQPAATDSAINTVVNALGNVNGIFHISRTPSASDPATTALPLLIQAPGFQPLVQSVTVGADCQTASCAGSQPLTLLLSAVDSAEGTGAAQIAPSVQSLLSGATGGTQLSNILVLLNNPTGTNGNAASLVSGLLGTALIAGAPQVTGALAAANLLLPYLQPIAGQLGQSNAGTVGALVSSLLGGGTSGSGAQLAMAGLLPFVESLLGGSSVKIPAIAGATNPFTGILNAALGNNGLLSLLGNAAQATGGSSTSSLLTGALQPLIQGFTGTNGATLQGLFNHVVQQGGLSAIQNFPTGLGATSQFAALTPFLEPLIQGLNGTNGSQLATLITPFLSASNPAGSIAGILTNATSGGNSNLIQTVTSLFPSLSSVLSQAVPAKQVFGAQVLSGLLGGQFTSLNVTQDLAGASGVVVSGSASDILNLAQLPNVSQLVSVAPTSGN